MLLSIVFAPQAALARPVGPKRYPGRELELFALACNWKRYFGRRLRRWITGDVLEVGCGLGATTRALCLPDLRSWVCLEPDGDLLAEFRRTLAAQPLPLAVRLVEGTLEQLGPHELFDTILYIDVLEHIADDRSELRRAAARLRPGGRLVVLAPAHQWLFTPFDRAVGHFRRYNRQALRRLTPAQTAVENISCLDSAGMLASLANRWLLRAAEPSRRQILFWDRCLVPLSRWLDPLFAYRLGKSIVAVWRKASLALPTTCCGGKV